MLRLFNPFSYIELTTTVHVSEPLLNFLAKGLSYCFLPSFSPIIVTAVNSSYLHMKLRFNCQGSVVVAVPFFLNASFFNSRVSVFSKCLNNVTDD